MPKAEVKKKITDFLQKEYNLWKTLEPAVKERPRDVGFLLIGMVFGTVTGIIANVALLATINLFPEVKREAWGVLFGCSWGALVAWCACFWHYGRKLLRGEAI